jgi:menaquinone-dependent protoporphyrinogen oxidase
VTTMPTALIVYASTHGQTAKIAARLGEALRAQGLETRVAEVGEAGSLDPAAYDLAIVGASIHGGHHQREIVAWAKRHQVSLGAMPSAFFSVCLTVAEDTEESREATRGYLDDFADATGWTPTQATTFAGALLYREYDFMTRLVMRLLMARGHHPTDTSRDYEYTDWEAVDRFAAQCAGALARTPG